MNIKDWADADRPREKMIAQGKKALTNAELLAIIIGSGSANESAVALSHRILSSVKQSLTALGKLSLQELKSFKGIGEAKAISILATTELGKRQSTETPEVQHRMGNARNVFLLMQPFIGDLTYEEFWVLYLSSANRVLHKSRLSSGGITHTTVDIRLLLKTALLQGAVGIILVHNHPSGNVTPSADDIALTRKVSEASKLLDIKLIDHIIISEKEYYSLLESGVFF
nr:DNA repair protein RadC [uncultured Capnocytophaga sp.]